MCGRCCDDCCYECCSWIDPDARDAIKCCLFFCGIVGAVVLLVVLAVGFGYINHVKVAVEDASLTRFTLLTTPVTALAYNLSLTLTVRNPNFAMSIKYVEPLEAAYLFDGQRFDRVRLRDADYKQPAGKTEVYHLSSSSEGAYATLGNAGVVAYRQANATGLFEVEVDLSGKVRYQAHITKCKLAVSCPLKLQLAPPGTAAVVFQRVKCKVEPPEDKNC